MNLTGQILTVLAAMFGLLAIGYFVWATSEYRQGLRTTAGETRDTAIGMLVLTALLVIAIVVWGK